MGKIRHTDDDTNESRSRFSGAKIRCFLGMARDFGKFARYLK